MDRLPVFVGDIVRVAVILVAIAKLVGFVVADAQGRTGHAKVFVGGDCANGGKEVVNAAAEGKNAAKAQDKSEAKSDAKSE